MPLPGYLHQAPFTKCRLAMVPDDRDEREAWSKGLLCAATDADIVFVDPDKGKIKEREEYRARETGAISPRDWLWLWELARTRWDDPEPA